MLAAASVEQDAKILAAWNEYLEACQSADHPLRYDEVESWAWARLQQRLRTLDLQTR